LAAASVETIRTDVEALVAMAMVTDTEAAVATTLTDEDAVVSGGCVLYKLNRVHQSLCYNKKPPVAPMISITVIIENSLF
jgi:hypothetical protein